MIAATVVKLYPNERQKVPLEKHFASSRFVYNRFLAKRNEYYIAHKDTGKASLNYLDTQKLLIDLKKGHAWLYEVNSQSLQMSLRFLDNAFKLKLKWKAEKYGRNMIEICRFDLSSKLCSNCGSLKINLKLLGRIYHCDVCGLVIDRDYNTPKNIRRMGLIKVGLVRPEFTPVEIATSGLRGLRPYGGMSAAESGSSEALAEEQLTSVEPVKDAPEDQELEIKLLRWMSVSVGMRSGEPVARPGPWRSNLR